MSEVSTGALMTEWSADDILDLIDNSISDSFEQDWSSMDGAKAVVGALEHNGLRIVPTPEPAGELVERLDKIVRRSVMASVALGNWMSAALDDPKVCAAMKADIQEWFSAGEPELVQYARAAIAAIPDRAALVASLEATAEAAATHLKTAIDLRTQLAASQADVARLRELTEALSKADGLCTFNRGDHRTIEFAFDKHDDGHKAFELLSDALAAIKDTQP